VKSAGKPLGYHPVEEAPIRKSEGKSMGKSLGIFFGKMCCTEKKDKEADRLDQKAMDDWYRLGRKEKCWFKPELWKEKFTRRKP
jgi:hypothetical protein